MKRRIPSLATTAALGLMFLSCATQAGLLRMSSQDLNCDEDSLIVFDKGRRATVSGCGRTARYNKVCEDSNWTEFANCHWMMIDAPSTPQPLAPTSPPPSPPPPAAPSDTLPQDALGFRFGASVEEARAACEDAEHHFTISKDDETTFYCDGSPTPVGVPIRESLSFCDEELCKMVALAQFTPDENGDRRLSKVLQGLIHQYGRPDLSKTQLAQGCTERTAQCVHRGQARWNATWRWSHSLHQREGLSKGGTRRPARGVFPRQPKFLVEQR